MWGALITLGGLAYTVLYSVNLYSGVSLLSNLSYYLFALFVYNACAVATLATRHPCYTFLDVGVTALFVNLLFVFYRTRNQNSKEQFEVLELILRTTLFLAFTSLFANFANCVDGCCKVVW
jgi:hypothetical protein